MNSLVAANLSCLQQGISFLESLPEGIYTRPCADLFESTIGGHMRHSLDHYTALANGLKTGKVDYDNRDREERLEVDLSAAITRLKGLMEILELIGTEELDLRMQIRMDDGGDSTWSSTSLCRELQFLLSHTIHHYALIVSIGKHFGVGEYPENFGIAPSTLHHKAACEA